MSSSSEEPLEREKWDHFLVRDEPLERLVVEAAGVLGETKGEDFELQSS
jgi:hypothetical protein